MKMRAKKLVALFLTVLLLVVSVMGCSTKSPSNEPSEKPSEAVDTPAPSDSTEPDAGTDGSETLKVGFSELAIDGAWRVCQVESMQSEAEKRGYGFVMTNAELNAQKQISDVEDLLAQDVDFLIIAPMDMEAIVPALASAKEKNVPVLLIDRQANGVWGEDFISTIIADYLAQGHSCAEWLESNVEGEIKIVEITGKVGGSDVRDRAAGFREVTDNNDNMTIVSSQSGEWSRAETQNVMQNIIQSTGGDFNAVYCHNDEMALGAILALKAAGMNPGEDVKVVAIDGQKEAVEAIIAGDINAIATCSPRFGPAAFDAMESYLAGEQLDEVIINPETLITEENAEQELPNAF